MTIALYQFVYKKLQCTCKLQIIATFLSILTLYITTEYFHTSSIIPAITICKVLYYVYVYLS